MKKSNHNKKRNSALLYEFLIKHISKCLIEDKKEEANKALAISKEHFSDGSPLRNELKLFHSVLNSTVKSKESAHRILDSVCKTASLMNSRILDESKSKLIKDINYNLSKDVYEYKVSDYTSYASLQVLFNESRTRQKKLQDVDKIKLEDFIVGKLTESKNKSESVELKKNPDYNNLVYRLVVNKFHEKYNGKLTEGQKKLITQYVLYMISENKLELEKYLVTQVKFIREALSTIKDPSLVKDKELTSRIKECKEKFESLDFSTINDSLMMEILAYLKLAEEIRS